MRPTTKLLFTGLLALTLPLAACGDDDTDVSSGDDTTTTAPDTSAPDTSDPGDRPPASEHDFVWF